MVALDTNLLVRFATGDDLDQAQRVQALLDRERCLIPVTVVLETEWVLRSRYAFKADKIAEFFEYLLTLDQILFPEALAIQRALDQTRQGLDFADALHCALASDAPLVTLDRVLLKRGTSLGLNVMVLPKK